MVVHTNGAELKDGCCMPYTRPSPEAADLHLGQPRGSGGRRRPWSYASRLFGPETAPVGRPICTEADGGRMRAARYAARVAYLADALAPDERFGIGGDQLLAERKPMCPGVA